MATWDWDKVSRTVLDPKKYTGGDAGDEHFANIDLDGDDISDSVLLSCSASETPGDPCILQFKLSGGKAFEFAKEYVLGLYRWRGRVYAIGRYSYQATTMRVYGFSRAGITKLCTISGTGQAG
jgi:hypothetical protein